MYLKNKQKYLTISLLVLLHLQPIIYNELKLLKKCNNIKCVNHY